MLDDVPSQRVGREALVERIVTVAERLRRDDVVMSVLRSAPDLAMIYIAERLGTSQQILLDAVAADIKLAQEEGSVRPGDPRQLARDVPADHPVDDPVRADRRTDPRCRRTRRRARPLIERIPEDSDRSSTALNDARRASELAALADGDTIDVIVIGGGITGVGIALDAATRGSQRCTGGEARLGLRHQPMEQQAGARRSAIPRDGQCRHRPAQRGRTRNPDDAQRPSPRQGHAAAGSAAAVDEHRLAGAGAVRFRGR